nr:hypothetical protein [Tanacetum cinerariifolium]
YALTINPTVYVSHIRQFWSTARIETTNEETKILATVDGKPRTISESSPRRHLKLNDDVGISSLPDRELFENLSLMGYNILPNQIFTFQKGKFSHQWKFLIHTIMQCLSPKSTDFNEFSRNIATAVVCLATNRVFLMVCPSFSRRIVPLFPTMLVTMGEGSGTPTEPHHTPPPEVQQTSHTATSLQSLPPVTTATIPTENLKEATVVRKCIALLRQEIGSSLERIQEQQNLSPQEIRMKLIKVGGMQIFYKLDINHKLTLFRQDSRRDTRIAMSKALSPAADELASLLRDNSQGEAFLTVSSLDAGQDRENIIQTSVLPHESSPRVTSLDADKGREEVGVERSTKLGSNDTDEMVNVLSDMEAANIFTSRVATVSVSPVAAVTTVGIPTVSGLVPTVSAIFTTARLVTPYLRRPREISAKDKGERMKRKGLNLDQRSAKKMKTSEDVSEEDLKGMMQLVHVEEALVKETLSIKPVTKDKDNELWVELKRLFGPDFEDQLWTHTQNLMHDPLDWKLYDTCGVHHVSTKDQEIFILVERDYPLRRGLAIVMICNKIQVENYSHMANDLILKIHNIANSPR